MSMFTEMEDQLHEMTTAYAAEKHRREKLEAEVAELSKDRERLDWLEKKGTIDIECWGGYPDTYSVDEQIEDGEKYKSLREAIDKAMAEGDNRQTPAIEAGSGADVHTE